jgi:ribonuclease BN (tRNA processing enzyme)
MERFELVPLGAGGYIPAGRQTMSFLVQHGERCAILDAGSGLARLVEPGVLERLARVPRLDIALTHFHLDHVIGLSYLPGVWSQRPTRVLAPRPPLVDGEPELALDHLLSPPLFPISWREFPGPVTLETYDESGFELLGERVRVRRQRHAGASAAMRFGDRLVYATDTEPDDATIDFARGAGTLIHELWLDDEDAAQNPPAMRGHSATAAVARIARQAGVGRLIPVHHHPRYDAERIERLAERLRADFPGEVVVPREGAAIQI